LSVPSLVTAVRKTDLQKLLLYRLALAQEIDPVHREKPRWAGSQEQAISQNGCG
jgi:hypothetical protein